MELKGQIGREKKGRGPGKKGKKILDKVEGGGTQQPSGKEKEVKDEEPP